MEGTVRTLAPAIQDMLPGLIERTAGGISRALGGDCEVRYVKGYPPTMNDAALFELVSKSVNEAFGGEHFVPVEKPDLGGEDFSFFARERPALMAWLGCRPVGQPVEKTAVLHNTHFDPDESCFTYGVRFLAGCAADYLRQ